MPAGVVPVYAAGPSEVASLKRAYNAAEAQLAEFGLREIDREYLAAVILSLFKNGLKEPDEVVRTAVQRIRSRQVA